jgi:hypothetical protein
LRGSAEVNALDAAANAERDGFHDTKRCASWKKEAATTFTELRSA